MLALVSGCGALPRQVFSSQPVAPLVCALEGFAPEGLEANITFRLENLGMLIADLKARGVSEVCFCGSIARPPFDASVVDAATLPLARVLTDALGAGDDAALRAVMGLFEQERFRIRAVQDLAPHLLAPEGVLSQAQPDDQMRKDIARADAILSALAALDVGQGCVVGAGQVWGLETVGGTDHMLATLPDGAPEARAVLVKRPKAGQDLRADLPTIGPTTIDAAARAGLAGVVIEAGRVLVLDRADTIARANDAGLVLWSRVTR
jgi:DUF1009 family protein